MVNMATQKDENRPRREGAAQSTWQGNISFVVTGLLLALLMYRYWPCLSSCCSFHKETKEETSSQEQQLRKLASAMDHGKDVCSKHGQIQIESGSHGKHCQCHPCFTGKDCSIPDRSCIININQGDPKVFEDYWIHTGEDSSTKFSGWQSMSYYADSKQFFFVQTELDSAIRLVHEVVGNAVTEGRHLVIGTGSTQLFQAALYALSADDLSLPKKVVSLAPYYSAYPALTDYLKSALYHWGGDAAQFEHDKESNSYIELVTTPNNPSGEVRYPVVNGSGSVIHDLAYYWPHYTPITSPADEDLMLFTLSKSTGHAGTRIGWAIVKDSNIAKKMAKFVELNTIGVSKEAQFRAAQVLMLVAKDYEQGGDDPKERISFQEFGEDHVSLATGSLEENLFFHFGSFEMERRWIILRMALNESLLFGLPTFEPEFCTFSGMSKSPTPAFAWLECLREDDCEMYLKQHNILARGGGSFGTDPRFVRLSMLDTRGGFDALIDRLESIGGASRSRQTVSKFHE